jgi:hypothetical protein
MNQELFARLRAKQVRADLASCALYERTDLSDEEIAERDHEHMMEYMTAAIRMGMLLERHEGPEQ